MTRLTIPRILVILSLSLAVFALNCKKSSTTNGPTNTVPTYPVSAVVLGPTGAPQGGATLTLQNPPYADASFSGITDTSGKATIMSPEGPQVLLAKMGTVFQATINVTVAASQTPTVAGTLHLQQVTSLGKTLVIYAGCEQLENVLKDTVIGFNQFDTTDVYAMRNRAAADSVATLNFLKQYALVFSDCNCGDEYGYPVLARVYGRYVQQGGKIYGGHYNYYNLQFIFPPNYTTYASATGNLYSLKVVDANLSKALGATVMAWPSSLNSYSLWSDIPATNTTVFAVIDGSTGSTSSPQGIPIIVENRVGTGKYVWTTYHNQDIIGHPELIRIVRYFLYYM